MRHTGGKGGSKFNRAKNRLARKFRSRDRKWKRGENPAEKRHRENGVQFWLVGLNPGVLAAVQRSPLGEALGRDRMFFNLEQAVERYLALPARSNVG